METFAIIMVLASFVVGIFGLINIAKPLGWLKITRRLHGAAVFGASIVAFFLFSLLGAASQPGGLSAAPAEASTKAPEVKEKADAPSEVAAKKPVGVTQAEFNAMWSQMKSVVGQCDAAVAGAQEGMKTGDVYKAYPRIQRAVEVCRDASLDAYNVEVPRSAKGEIRKKLLDGRDACQMSIIAKQIAMESVGKVANGDGRPSAVSKAQEDMERSGQGALHCAVGFMSAANEAGLVLPEVEDASTKTQ